MSMPARGHHGGHAGGLVALHHAHAIGAEPRCLGRSDAWTLIVPSGGISRIFCERICPNAAVTHKSGWRFNKSSYPSRLIRSGLEDRDALLDGVLLDGGHGELLAAPLWAVGCVTTPTTEYPPSTKALRDGTAKSGVPINTILTGCHPPGYAPRFPPASARDPSRRCTACRPGDSSWQTARANSPSTVFSQCTPSRFWYCTVTLRGRVTTA